ncbi:MAG: hypothetical protein IPJ43_16645 [Saprospiraceae bacterium]|nr:hypothetical protein [Saprospiraceae bacterium]
MSSQENKLVVHGRLTGTGGVFSGVILQLMRQQQQVHLDIFGQAHHHVRMIRM